MGEVVRLVLEIYFLERRGNPSSLNIQVGMDDRQAGKLTSLVPTVQTSSESQVDIGRVEKPIQVRGKNRNHGEP